MTKRAFIPVLAGLALAGCEARIGTDGNAAEGGEAVENQVSIEAPGIDIKVAMPDDVRVDADMKSDSDLLYPGSELTGISIDGTGEGMVDLRFTSTDAPAAVDAWYRDSARTGFAIDAAAREGEGFVLNGHETDGSNRFKLRLSPGSGGGTDGHLSLQDAN